MEQGVNPLHRGQNGESAVFSILCQIDHDESVETYTHEQVDMVRQCISLLYSHRVGSNMDTITTTLQLVRRMHRRNPALARLHEFVLMAFESRGSFGRDTQRTRSVTNGARM